MLLHRRMNRYAVKGGDPTYGSGGHLAESQLTTAIRARVLAASC